MALYPTAFIEELKQHADIVTVIQDYVSLKKAGTKYKGLCPFHGEKTPSFTVDRDKGFFHCFGCQAGGDVIKFIELHEKLGFMDAVKQLAQRFGMTLPEPEQSEEHRAGTAERESLLKIHEVAAAWFRDQLASPAGTRIRKLITERGLTRGDQRGAWSGLRAAHARRPDAGASQPGVLAGAPDARRPDGAARRWQCHGPVS